MCGLCSSVCMVGIVEVCEGQLFTRTRVRTGKNKGQGTSTGHACIVWHPCVFSEHCAIFWVALTSPSAVLPNKVVYTLCRRLAEMVQFLPQKQFVAQLLGTHTSWGSSFVHELVVNFIGTRHCSHQTHGTFGRDRSSWHLRQAGRW